MERTDEPLAARIGEAPGVEGAAPAPGAGRRRRVAVLAVHGMGQQAQFETLASVAERLAGPDVPVTVRAAAMTGGEFRRAEVVVDGVDVHVYEGYWAPITEGRVTLRDVMSFLWGAAIGGIRNAASGFTRYAFGRVERGHRRWGTLAALVVTSLVLAALVVVDATALAIAASRAGLPEWLPRAALDDATWLALIFVLCAVALAVWIGAAASARPFLRWRATAPIARGTIVVTWALFALTLAAAIACGAGVVALVATAGTRAAPLASPPPTSVLVGAWGGLALASLVARRLFVQFAGDVAAYVSPQKLDRFHELRGEIKDAVRKVAVAIYEDRSYDGVAIVGHSLGSVVAYDTLNALLREDELAARPEARRGVLDRTRVLLTFGSPLDKTAFIFANAPKDSSATREALAALSQPLLLDERYQQRIPWVNVHSPADPVSGRLDLYGPRVQNERDPHATTPLLAHTEYWGNDLVWTRLREAIARHDVPVRGEQVAKPERATVPAAKRKK